MNKIIITLIFMVGFENLLQASWCSAISCSSTPIQYFQQDKDLKNGFDLIGENYEDFVNNHIYVGDNQKVYADQEIKEVRKLAIRTISDGMSPSLQAILKNLNNKSLYICQLEKKDKDILYYAIAHKNFHFNIDPIFEEIFNNEPNTVNVQYNSYILHFIPKHFIPKNHSHIIGKAEYKLHDECTDGNNVDMIRFLICYVDVNERYDDNMTPLMLVAMRNKNSNALEIAKCLVAHGASIYKQDSTKYTAERLARQSQNYCISNFLIDEDNRRQEIKKQKEENSSCNIS